MHRIEPNCLLLFFVYYQQVELQFGNIPPEEGAVIATSMSFLLLYQQQLYEFMHRTEINFVPMYFVET